MTKKDFIELLIIVELTKLSSYRSNYASYSDTCKPLMDASEETLKTLRLELQNIKP